jgi:hypothetical protein
MPVCQPQLKIKVVFISKNKVEIKEKLNVDLPPPTILSACSADKYTPTPPLKSPTLLPIASALATLKLN